MTDVFLSYASQDKPRAEKVARLLEQRGRAVWWDRKIPIGKPYDVVIAEALDRARCVLVLWSQTSVGSDWVKEEAAEGVRRKILVPALLDDVTIPLGFRRFQAARLIGWQGSEEDPEVRSLVESIDAILGGGPAAVDDAATTASLEAFLLERARTRNTVLSGPLANGRFSFSDGALLEWMTAPPGNLKAILRSVELPRELTAAMVASVLNTAKNWRQPENVLDKIDPEALLGAVMARKLTSRGGTHCFIDPGYLQYVHQKYPAATIHVLGSKLPIVIAEGADIRCIVMPVDAGTAQ